MNFTELTEIIIKFIVSSVQEIHDEHPNEHIYAVMFHCFYGDGSVIYPPALTVGTEELLHKVVKQYTDSGYTETSQQLMQSLRWSGADLADYMFEDDEKLSEITENISAYASQKATFAEWQVVYNDFLQCFPRACKQATVLLRTNNYLNDDFIAVAVDEEGLLIAPSVSHEEFKKYFSHYIK